jgi:hypothetical protein
VALDELVQPAAIFLANFTTKICPKFVHEVSNLCYYMDYLDIALYLQNIRIE